MTEISPDSDTKVDLIRSGGVKGQGLEDTMPGLNSSGGHPSGAFNMNINLNQGTNQCKYPTYPYATYNLQPDSTDVEESDYFTAAPQLLWKIKNREDQHPLKLYHPYDVIFNGPDIVVVEGFWPYSRIQIFNNNGKSRRKFAQGQILPFGVTLTPEGHLAMTDHRDRTVKMYTKEGQLWLSWQPDMFNWPNGITVDNFGNYIIADWSAGLLSMHAGDGQKLRTIQTSRGSESSPRSCPQYVTVDPFQRIIMSDAFDHTIKIFNTEGNMLLRFGNEDGPGKICDPRGVITDLHGNITVADWGGNRVIEYSPDGRWIRNVLGCDQVQNPWGLDRNENGLLALTEQKLNASPSLKLYG